MDRNELVKKIEDKILLAVRNGVFPGANYGLLIDGQSYTGSLGFKALIPEKERNDVDTVYDIASLTKVIGTTTAILKLLDTHKITLEDPISNYLDFIKNDDVKIKDLLTHSSGYPALTPGTTEMTTKEPLLHDLMNCQLEYETNSKVVYSDVGFMYLGFIIEKITGSMPAYLEENFFGPLGMKDTRFNHKEIIRIAPTEQFGFRGIIRGFCHDEKGYLLDGVAGHAGLYSTVGDLLKFAQMLLNDRSYISEESIQLIRTKYMEDDGVHRSIGWIVKEVDGHEVIYHTGYTGTNILVDFEKDLSFVLLSNRVHPTRENIKIIQFRKELESLIYNNLSRENQ